MNFGILKHNINKNLSESISNKTENKLFEKYLKLLKTDKLLFEQFKTYSNLEKLHTDEYDKAKFFIKESLRDIVKYSPEEIEFSNNKLKNLFEGMELEFDYANGELHKNIHTLLTKRGVNKEEIEQRYNATENIAGFIKENVIKNEVKHDHIPNTMLGGIMLNKFIEKYKGLNESEIKLISLVLKGSDDEKDEFFRNTINECLNLIDEKYELVEKTTKEKLLKAKHKLLNLLNNKTTLNENFISEISKIVELKDSLNVK